MCGNMENSVSLFFYCDSVGSDLMLKFKHKLLSNWQIYKEYVLTGDTGGLLHIKTVDNALVMPFFAVEQQRHFKHKTECVTSASTGLP